MEEIICPSAHQARLSALVADTSSRRQFLRNVLSALAVCAAPAFATTTGQLTAFQGKDIFNRIQTKAVANNWRVLPIGDLIGKIALQLEGTHYKANTLELSVDSEICSVNLTALDCVTFFETSLAFARMLKKGGRTPEELLTEIGFIRYRGGKPGDYSTRLHYTTDWFADNESKHVVELLSRLPGSETFKQKVSIMTDHPESCPQLVAQPLLIPKIKRLEDSINRRVMKFVPMEKIAVVEPLLRTGDIVGICSNEPGLDIAHTGLVICGHDGLPHFMDATSRKSKLAVVVEPGPLSQALNRSKSLIGAMFARPLEP